MIANVIRIIALHFYRNERPVAGKQMQAPCLENADDAEYISIAFQITNGHSGHIGMLVPVGTSIGEVKACISIRHPKMCIGGQTVQVSPSNLLITMGIEVLNDGVMVEHSGLREPLELITRARLAF